MRACLNPLQEVGERELKGLICSNGCEVLIPFRKSGRENMTFFRIMNLLSCLNPLQEVGEREQETPKNPLDAYVLIPFRKSGRENIIPSKKRTAKMS